MYATIKEKVGMLILVMLLICGAVNAQHWRHYCYYPSNRVVTVVVKPDMLHYISNRFNRKERLAMAMAYLKTNKYLTIKQYAKMTQLSRAAAEAELDAFAMDKKNPIQLVIRGKKKIYTTDSNYSIRSDISCVSIAYDPDHFYCAGKGME